MSPLFHTFLAETWRPFLQPLDLHAHWLWLLLPLVFAVALVYKALKLEELRHLPAETLRLTSYILILLAGIALVLWGVVELL